MSAELGPVGDSAAEASRWFARMNANSVTTAELEAFRAWRRAPSNALAYAEIERVWRDSGALQTDPDIQAALAAVRPRRGFAMTPTRAWLGGGVALAALCVGVFVVASFPGGSQVYQTTVGEQSTVALADGSRLKLDTDTRVSVRLSRDRRVVTLEQGQVLFDVVHRPDRPFQVAVGPARIDDIGTVFDVRRDADQVRVTLVSGAVRVAAGGGRPGQWSLLAGQQLVVGPKGGEARSIDPARATSWASGRLLFDDLPLALATQEVNRYARHKIVLDAGAVNAVRVSGAFESSDTEAFVAAVSKLYDLTARQAPDGSIVLSAPSEKPSA